MKTHNIFCQQVNVVEMQYGIKQTALWYSFIVQRMLVSAESLKFIFESLLINDIICKHCHLHIYGAAFFQIKLVSFIHLVFLNVFQEKRLGLLKKHQKSIKQLWTELEIDPYTEFEIALCSETADEDFSLSAENLEKLKSLQDQVCYYEFFWFSNIGSTCYQRMHKVLGENALMVQMCAKS